MKTTVIPLLAILSATLLLSACASDDGGFWHHHHDHDRDRHDNHLMGALTQPAGPAAPGVAAGR